MIGILLAAGFSRRFGPADKLLQILPDGRPMALAAAENMIKAIPLTIAVVRPDNKELADLLENSGLKVVFCDRQETEMANSLSAAVHFAAQFNESSAGFVIALADMPYIKSDTIKAIAHELNAGAAIVAPAYHNKRGHPVGFSARFRNELEHLTGDEGARSILKHHTDQIKLLECNDPGIIADIDTPEDLRAKPHT